MWQANDIFSHDITMLSAFLFCILNIINSMLITATLLILSKCDKLFKAITFYILPYLFYLF